MELAKIESLLEAYFEGNTSLNEEAQLRAYFRESSVAAHLQQYQPLFKGFEKARGEVSQREIILPQRSGLKFKSLWYGIAASAVIALFVANYIFSEPSLSQDEKEALTALKESKKAMFLLSENFNKGAEQLALVNQFTETKNKILK
jgi:hypothetical protein